MSTFLTIKANVRSSLGDDAISYYSAVDLHDAVQDAYDQVVFESRCIVKKVTLDWVANTNYFDFLNDFEVDDYMATIAIFDNLNNRWLCDSLSIRQFREFRLDWELIYGSPQYWAPKDPKYVCIFPKHAAGVVGTFDLYYWATAPTVVNGDTPLVPSDKLDLIENLAIGSLLESAEEFKKAQLYFNKVNDPTTGIQSLSRRVSNIAMSDLIRFA